VNENYKRIEPSTLVRDGHSLTSVLHAELTCLAHFLIYEKKKMRRRGACEPEAGFVLIPVYVGFESLFQHVSDSCYRKRSQAGFVLIPMYVGFESLFQHVSDSCHPSHPGSPSRKSESPTKIALIRPLNPPAKFGFHMEAPQTSARGLMGQQQASKQVFCLLHIEAGL
jgi:hypothetical protein